jgi:Transglutaminase-like superfamily
MTLMNRWHGFHRLSGLERGIVLEAAFGLAATWVGLRLVGFRRWKGVLERVSQARTADAGPVGAAADGAHSESSDGTSLATACLTARTLELAARHLFFQPNCLEQSLVLWWLLRIRSIRSELRVGGRKADDCFEAHAWVECGGAVLSRAGEGHLHFVPFDGPIPDWEPTSQ